MRTRSICLVLAVMLLSPCVSAQWVQTSLDSGIVTCIAIRGANLFAGTWGGSVFHSTDNGTSWTEGNTGLTGQAIVALAVLGTDIFAAAGAFGEEGGGVFLSTDSGTTWTTVGLRDSVVTDLSVSGTNLFAGTWEDGVFLSTDSGTSWSARSEGLPEGPPRYPSIEAFAVIDTSLFTGIYGYGVFRTTNDGTSWTDVNSGLTENHIGCLAVSGTNLFAGTVFWSRGSVFRSTNKGESWTEVGSGLPGASVTTLAVSDGILFAGTEGGKPSVFMSSSFGASWTEFSSGLPKTDVNSLVISGMHIFAGTYNGVWRRPLSEVFAAVDPGTGGLADALLLQQNYPNPFNPSTTIKYQLPKSTEVRLSVFDVLGREVSVLVNERRGAGVHEVKCEGSNLASGVYFYRLHAGGFVQTKKLVRSK